MTFQLNSNLLLVVVASLALSVQAQMNPTGGQGSLMSNIPGAQTAAQIIASSSDGMARYLAADGPIQPAITAIGGLPMRGAEMANRGINQISRSFASGANSMSRAAGTNGNMAMPGMQALESHMPASIANMGGMLRQGIAQKNTFIRGQAQRGVEAGQRLISAMGGTVQSVQARGMGHMENMGKMVGSAHGSMMKGGKDIKNQLQQSVQGHIERLSTVKSMGDNMMGSVQKITQTLGQGVTQAVSQLHQTGEQVRGELKNGLQQNTKLMTNIVGSMQGSMGNIGKNMHKGMEGLASQAQNAIGQVGSHLQKAASAPFEMMQKVTQSLPMKSTSGARY